MFEPPGHSLIYQDILYYVEVESRTVITLHRGENTGPVIAKCDLCQEKQGSSKIHIEPATTVILEHTPCRFFLIPAKTSFSVDDKKYCWRGQSQLFDAKRDKLIALYHPNPMEDTEGNIGQLLIAESNTQLTVLVIMTAFVEQRRSDLFKAVSHTPFDSNKR